MRTFASILVLLLVVGALLAAADVRPRPGGGQPVEARPGAPRHDADRPAEAPKGVELAASLPKKVFGRGEAIGLSLEFRNNSDSPVTFIECGFWPNHHVAVRDRRGREAEKTDQWRDKRYGVSDRSGPVVIKPGKSFDYGKQPVDLAPLYKLPPGNYSVRVIYDEPSPSPRMKVSSEAIGFTVE